MSPTLAPSTVTARDPKGLKFISIVEAQYNKAALSEVEAQRLNDSSGLADLIANFIADGRQPNKYKDEEVRSSYVYPDDYAVKDIAEQVAILAELFPQLDTTATLVFLKDVLPTLALPEGAEGWFAIPRWDKLAATYGQALEVVLKKIADSRRFFNYREGALGPKYLAESARTAMMLEKVMETQTGDILIIAAQFGLRHRGRSVRRARVLIEDNTPEYGLGAVALGSMLLTHEKREQRWEQLHIDCAGDVYSPNADGQFDLAPLFDFYGGELKFDANWVSYACGYFGSASGFLPQ